VWGWGGDGDASSSPCHSLMEIWRFKDNRVTTLTFCSHVTLSVTDHSTRDGPFPMGGPL